MEKRHFIFNFYRYDIEWWVTFAVLPILLYLQHSKMCKKWFSEATVYGWPFQFILYYLWYLRHCECRYIFCHVMRFQNTFWRVSIRNYAHSILIIGSNAFWWFWLFRGFSLEVVDTASVKDICFRGSLSRGGDVGSNHMVDRDLCELEGVGGFSAWLPLNPSPTSLWSHAQVSPIQVGVSTGIKPPSTWDQA